MLISSARGRAARGRRPATIRPRAGAVPVGRSRLERLTFEQLLDQRLHVPAGLALVDESAEVSPNGREVPTRFDLVIPDGLPQLCPSRGKAGVEIAGSRRAS